MSDIVERLRKRMVRRELGDDPLVKVFGDAADEIERLRADLKEANEVIRQLQQAACDREGGLREIIYAGANEIERLQVALQGIRAKSAQMAEDDGLWFGAATAAEAYLQSELRKLCAVIEGVSPDECARAAYDCMRATREVKDE
jgi:hypothetical protein